MPDPLLSSKPSRVKVRPAVIAPYTNSVGPARTNPQHPCLGAVTSAMHDDSYQSDTSPLSGPYGTASDVLYWKNGETKFGGICASFGFDSKGRALTMSFSRESTKLLRFDPKTLRPVACIDVPPRGVTIWDGMFKVDALFKSTAGAYFTLDNHDRVIIPTTSREIWVVRQIDAAPGFELAFRIPTGIPEDDSLNSAMPVWDERPHSAGHVAPSGYWFLTQGGRVGVARPAAMPQVKTFRLPNGEVVGNSFALGRKGLFVVSQAALYRLVLDGDSIRVVFRTPYEAGTHLKPGQLAPGSGTTPTLLGDRWVAIGDNSKVMQCVVMSQDDGRVTAQVPVFADQAGSACENSFIGHDDFYVVSNTYGYVNPMRWHRNERVPGIVRIDVAADGKATTRWYRDDVAAMSAIPKLSLARGLVYVYTMRWLEPPKPATKPQLSFPGTWRWTLLGLDVGTGATAYEQVLFEGRRTLAHDNGWGTFAPGPDGAVFLGMWRGALRVAT